VNRAKNGDPSTHPLSGVELRALRRLKRESIESPFVFVSERGSPFTTAGYRKMIARLGEAARFSFPVHPHMFRHARGYKLANDGRDTRALQHYLGHIQSPGLRACGKPSLALERRCRLAGRRALGDPAGLAAGTL
jgi:type 1 fimbriae regulatory protein FimB/type 1 fimbriae regulatory protein FimE